MEEKPKVVVSRTRRTEATAPNFTFTQEMIAASSGFLAAYRTRAWEAFQRLPIPSTTEEVWRRTDIHTMPADTFAFPKEGAYHDLPPVPENLLKPLVADQHGGQIVLLPGGSQIDLGEKLARQGVIFTDLKTALEKHADLVAKLI